MKKTITGLFLPLLLLTTFAVHAQTAEEVVAKYIDAIGGKDLLQKVNSVYLEGSVQMMGNESPTSVTLLNGKGYKTESEFNGQKMVQCYTDKGGWSINPMSGGNAEPMPEELYKAGKEQIDVGGALYDYAAKGSTVTLQGKEKDGYKLLLVSKDKVATTYYFDPTTWYLTKLVKKGNMMGQEIEIVISLSDYKKADIGYMIPYNIETNLGGQFTFTTTIKKVELNKPVDPVVFSMPK